MELKKNDLDEALTLDYNTTHNNSLTIHEIFNDLSHLEFRTLERKRLKSIMPEIQLISCGGGTPCYFDNIDYMLATGVVLWLQTPLELILQRIAKSGRPIPILAGQNRKNQPAVNLAELLENRRSFYKRAHYHMNEIEMLEYLAKVFKK